MGQDPPDDYARMIARHSGDSIIVTDVQGRTEWTNAAFARMSGYDLSDCLGRTPGSVLQGAGTDPATVDRIREALRNRSAVKTEILNYSKTGQPYWIDLHITPVFDAGGRHTHFMSIERDITERKALEAASTEVLNRDKHREAERLLLSQVSEWLYSAKSFDELLMVVRRAIEVLMPEAEGALYLYSNSRNVLERVTSWGEGAFLPIIAPDTCWALRRGRAYSYGLRPIEFSCEHAEQSRQSAHPYFCVPILAHGEAMGLIQFVFSSLRLTGDDKDSFRGFLDERWTLALMCAEQISLAVANVRLRQELMDQSIRDPLTGLCNRRWLRDTMVQAIDTAKANATPLSIISADLDNFKLYNDQHGHDAGDLVLREAARAMAAVVSDRGEVCRLGGEEFLVLAPGLDHEDGLLLAEDIRTALDMLIVPYDGGSLPPATLSAGVATFPEDGTTPLELMKSGDRAMYRAKSEGRNRVVSARRKDPSPTTVIAPRRA